MSPSAATRTEWSRRLAQALVSAGELSDADAAALVEESAGTGVPLGSLLVAKGRFTPQGVMSVLGQLSQLPTVDLYTNTPTPEAMSALPAEIAAEYGAIGYAFHEGTLHVAFGEPPSPDDVRDLSSISGATVSPVLADAAAIQRLHSVLQAPPAPEAQGPSASGEQVSYEMGETLHPADGNGAGPAQAMNPAQAAAAAAIADMALHIDDLLRYAVSVGASDLHLTSHMPGCIRLHGAIRPIEGCPVLENETIRDMIFGILPASQRERFEEEKELDTSHSIAGVGRFRVNVFMQRGTVAAALRSIPHEIPDFDSLSIPESVRAFSELRRGLVLVTGPTGSGKSTTLASIVDIINRSKPLHIITIEDPIEFLHNHKRAIVNQREVGEDTKSFSEALRRVLREDPDVILVGEMRDLETISMALTAAETGHLVFGTLHTQDAPQTIDRVIDVFPTNQQEQVRTMLSAALEGVVTQQLILNAEGTGRLAACEVMMCTPAIRNLIRSSKTHQIYSLMQTGATYGMQTMDQGLAKLVKEGRVSEAVAFDRCRNEDDLRQHMAS
ncbi:MAG: PilT/PilU family type 4a pilus ATPase [Acidimicrobiales bacterium]